VATDSTLIYWSLHGRPDAFVEVVRRHEAAVHGFMARRAGSQVADDLLGEVWVRAFAARRSFHSECPDARPWLYGVGRNVLRAHWRTAQRVELALREEVVDPWEDVVERLDASASAQVLLAGLRALPAGEREVLLLVAWEQLTPAEAAVVLGVPQGTARSRLHRARTALRLALAQDAYRDDRIRPHAR
jgi:RNA polymerase sigma-70 factor (ECF subfamily)